MRRAVVIGGGPAGLMAAEVLATAGHDVLVVDRMRTPGRKLTLAGRGGLNLTHSEPLETLVTRYGPGDRRLVRALEVFSPTALRAWAAGLGEGTFIGTSGRVFPDSFGATPLLRSWLDRLTRLGVAFEKQLTWVGWEPGPEGSSVVHTLKSTASGIPTTIEAGVTVLALGGASWPRTGSTGSWVEELRRHSVEVHELQPSNCGYRVRWSDVFRLKHAGKPLKNVAMTVEGVRRRGELLITDGGLEGGLIYAFGADLRRALHGTDGVEVEIDLRADVSVKSLAASLSSPRGSQSMSTWLNKRAHLSPTAIALLREVGPALPGEPGELARLIKAVPLFLDGPEGIDRAISSAGGVAFDELTDDFMLVRAPGVFVAGEMVDWDAPTGGYLLQASFSTGWVAGRGASEWLDRHDLEPA